MHETFLFLNLLLQGIYEAVNFTQKTYYILK